MPETHVNLKHLLEDIRDSYPCPIEEAVLTELIANSLDSHSSHIDIRIEPVRRWLIFVDDGEGMDSSQFEKYHDIASSAKVKGKGIGFAGIGAKLALLICDRVVTETRRGGPSLGSRWWLKTDSAKWYDDLGSVGLLRDGTGTAVRLQFHEGAGSNLLKRAFVEEVIRRHFYPLLDDQFARVLGLFYRTGVRIAVDGDLVTLGDRNTAAGTYFTVRVGKRKKDQGVGFLAKAAHELPDEHRGLAISTYGKVIKRGWDWLGIMPRNPAFLTGVVDVPALVECLTTNKCDFLKDPNSYQKYLKYRKAIQEALQPILKELGESKEPEAQVDKQIQKLQKEIENVFGEIIRDFPELEHLLPKTGAGARDEGYAQDKAGEVPTKPAAGESDPVGETATTREEGGDQRPNEPPKPPNHEPADDNGEPSVPRTIRRKRTGLMIGFDAFEGEQMARLDGETLLINSRHPAYVRVQGTQRADLYITFVVASTLSAHVQDGRPPFQFMQRFMTAWGRMQ